MVDSEVFLRQMQENLLDVVRPYQKRLNQQQKRVEFINLCVRSVGRDDFIQLDELLKSREAASVEDDPELEGCRESFERLRAYADEKVERYRIQFIEDLMARAQEADLPLTVDFPRLNSLQGIEGTVDFSRRTTTINKKVLKSIDPRRIVAALLKEKRELYDRPLDPQAFVDGLQRTYREILRKENFAPGHTVPIQRFYVEHVLSLQSKAFFQDMAKGKFRGYTVDQFAVDIWRTFQAGTGGTSDGHSLQLRSGRGNSFWLLDSEGQKRQISGISFQRVEP